MPHGLGSQGENTPTRQTMGDGDDNHDNYDSDGGGGWWTGDVADAGDDDKCNYVDYDDRYHDDDDDVNW